MPLITDPTPVPTPTEPTLTPLVPNPGMRPDGGFDGALVDLSNEKIDTLLLYVEGSQWPCTYYRQLLTTQSEPTAFQLKQLTVYQQYECIYDYPLRVNGPLTSTLVTEGDEFQVTGSAIIPFAIVPNVGDCFIADIGDGRIGLFSVTTALRKTVLKDTCYEVAYSLTEYLNDPIKTALKERTVRELHYSKDHLGSGRGPLIINSELSLYQRMKGYEDDMARAYYHEFYDANTATLLLPDVQRCYDPLVIKVYNQVVNNALQGHYTRPRELTIDGDRHYEKSIWKPLLEGQYETFSKPIAFSETVRSGQFFLDLIYNGVTMSQIETVILPSTNSETPYIFSIAFYERDRLNMSLLELLTDDYLSGKPIDGERLETVLTDSKNWSASERFYGWLICLILIRIYTQ